MYDFTVENNWGDVVIASFHNPMTKEKIYNSLRTYYGNILDEDGYTLHLYIGETEVKVEDLK